MPEPDQHVAVVRERQWQRFAKMHRGRARPPLHLRKDSIRLNVVEIFGIVGVRVAEKGPFPVAPHAGSEGR